MIKLTVGQVEDYVNAEAAGRVGLYEAGAIEDRKARYWLGRALEKCKSEMKAIRDHKQNILKQHALTDRNGNVKMADREMTDGRRLRDVVWKNPDAETQGRKELDEYRETEIEVADLNPIKLAEDDINMSIADQVLIYPFLESSTKAEGKKSKGKEKPDQP